MARPKYQVFVTPVGEAVFPHLSEADTRHNKDGIYKVDVSVPFELAQDFIAKLEKARDDFIKTLAPAKQRALTPKPVYIEEMTRPEYPEGADEDERRRIREAWVGEPTGNVLFRCKMNRIVRPQDSDAFEQAPVIVFAETGEKVEDPVWAGTMLKCKGHIVPYTNNAAGVAGISLRLKAAQVIDLVTGTPGEGFWTDFDDSEGGEVA